MLMTTIQRINVRSEKLIIGYVLLLSSFVMSETQNVDVNCTARPQSNVTLTLDQSSADVHQLILRMNGKIIASSRNLHAGWNEFILESYKKRLLLETEHNTTIHLWNVTNTDEATYEATIFSKEGMRSKRSWYLKLQNFTKPELTEDKLTISVTKIDGKYRCQCGSFKNAKIPQLSFKWNISNHKNHALDCPANVSASCTVTWPVSECQDIISTWTAEHRGEPAADGGSKSGTGRKKRSADDGCDQVNNTSPDSTHEATTGYTEVTPVNNDVVVVAAIVPIPVILLTAVILVIVIVIVIVTVYCLWRRKKCPKRQKDRNRNKRGPETKDEMMEIRKRGSPNFEHEAKDSPDEEKTEMMDQKEKST